MEELVQAERRVREPRPPPNEKESRPARWPTEPDDPVLAVAASCPMEATAGLDAGADTPAQP
jgi:hypothetical protein